MKTRIAAVATVLVLGVAPMSSVMAFESPSRYTSFARYDVCTMGSLDRDHRPPAYGGCPMSSAAGGNANQPSFPVQQHGHTSGGNRC